MSNERYTPTDIVERARLVLGSFDLDPASCAAAQENVKAEKWFSKEDDGLIKPWSGRVFCNPPGGRAPKNAHTQSNAALWWRKLSKEHAAGNVTDAIFIGFNLELLRSSQGLDVDPITAHDLCFPKKRICFLGGTGDGGSLRSLNQPTHANVIVYLGSDSAAFKENFSTLGAVLITSRR